MTAQYANIQDRFNRINRARFDYFVPHYLVKQLRKGERICSAGCGSGYDVALLYELGYDIWGFDLGDNTRLWQEWPPAVQQRLRPGFAQDLPFEKETFDALYALEVIEHVGCEDGIWKLLPDAAATRRQFFQICLDMLKPGGSLFVSTSNRLCCIDIGHGHHYHPFTDWMFRKFKIPLSIPWHPKNFVWSEGDVRRLLETTSYAGKYRITRPAITNYLSFSKRKSPLIRFFANLCFKLIDLPALRTSFLSPLLVLKIEKLA